jgi:hypothetical protein
MPAERECEIPRSSGTPLKLTLEKGQSVVIVGANGSGKTRLGVYIENKFIGVGVQRIAAQKTLSIRDDITIVSSERATKHLRYGHPDGTEQTRATHRWGNKPATHLLSDFDALLQMLFARHNRTAGGYLQDIKLTPGLAVPTTDLERLKSIWDNLLPHRTLRLLEAGIQVQLQSQHNVGGYSGSEMSDGERAIFYFLGQSLAAPDNGVLIIDEPEAHIHRAILSPLWDAIEKARPDCSFIYITHDLDFGAEHAASTRYYLRSYFHTPPKWDIEEIPKDTGLPESIVVELVGSRKPILFVEGERGSLDLTIYRNHYSGFTIVPIGSCEAVIHSVASYKNSAALHRLGAMGLVDADDRSADEIADLKRRGIYVLPVAEVENLLLLPSVFLAFAEALLCDQPADLLIRLTNLVLKEAGSNIDLVTARHTTRQLDRKLKCIGLSAKDLTTLQASYQAELATIDLSILFTKFRTELDQGIQTADLPEVLRLYDNKGLLALAASLLGVKDQRTLLAKLSRLLGGTEGKRVRQELTKVLPEIPL